VKELARIVSGHLDEANGDLVRTVGGKSEIGGNLRYI
jgi:hypothetical protein